MNEFVKQRNQFKKTRKLKTEVSTLQKKIGQLESQLEANKVFTFMVIHDLKHPTEAVVAQLETFNEKLQVAIKISKEIKLDCNRKENESLQRIKAITHGLDVVVNDMNKVSTGV